MTSSETGESNALARLASLAVGLAQDAGIGIELGETWHWDARKGALCVAREDLITKGVEYCAGIVAHEIGHFFLSRYPMFRPVLAAGKTSVVLDTFNAIEDPRVERWMGLRYPGVASWLKNHTHGGDKEVAHYPPQMPDHIVFHGECIFEPLRDWRPAAPDSLPSQVAAALDRTRAARRAYVDMTPSTAMDTIRADPALSRQYREEVWPNLSDMRGGSSDRIEQAVQRSAWQAAQLALREVLPEVLALYERDELRVARYLRDEEAARRAAEHALAQGDQQLARAVVGTALGEGEDGRSGQPGKEQRRLAQRLLTKISAAEQPRPMMIASQSGAARSLRPPMPPSPPGAGLQGSLPEETSYDRIRVEMAGQIDELTRHIEEVLVPRRRMRERAGYPSGARVDLRRLLVFEGDPRQYQGLWRRKSLPDRRDAAFSLLVDLSGSMRGEKSAAAVRGTIMVAETLSRVGIPFAINGFQDELIPFCNFGDGLTESVRQAIAEIPDEVAGTREGGHNQNGYNDDGPCLRAAAAQLQGWPAIDRLMIVISDGVPEGSHSTETDLEEAIRELSAPDSGLHLIGVGIGPHTSHVKRFYPEAKADVPLDQFAETLGAIVREKVLGES